MVGAGECLGGGYSEPGKSELSRPSSKSLSHHKSCELNRWCHHPRLCDLFDQFNCYIPYSSSSLGLGRKSKIKDESSGSDTTYTQRS